MVDAGQMHNQGMVSGSSFGREDFGDRERIGRIGA
jgi:hypothetical protein